MTGTSLGALGPKVEFVLLRGKGDQALITAAPRLVPLRPDLRASTGGGGSVLLRQPAPDSRSQQIPLCSFTPWGSRDG
jgi:hypothetical protein